MLQIMGKREKKKLQMFEYIKIEEAFDVLIYVPRSIFEKNLRLYTI